MKTKKKVLVIALAALLLVGSVFGTMAWLHDKDTESAQVFALGDIGIDLTYVALDAKANGVDKPSDNVLVPNKTYTLNPTIKVDADSEECYVRIFMKINGWETFKGMLRDETTLEKFISTVDTSKAVWADGYYTSTFSADTWEDEAGKLTQILSSDEDGIFEFRYKTTVAKAATDTTLAVPFASVTLPYYFNNEDVANLVRANFSIEFEAQAVQADYMAEYNGVDGVNEDDAWYAFAAMMNSATTPEFYETSNGYIGPAGGIDNENYTYGD